MIILVTGRNEVVAKVMFLQLCVILFTGGGLSASVHAGIPPLPRRPPCQGDPPPRRPPKKEAPPKKETLPRRRHPPRRHHPEGGTPPPRRRHPPRRRFPPRSRLRHTVNEWPVRILLECILVEHGFMMTVM